MAPSPEPAAHPDHSTGTTAALTVLTTTDSPEGAQELARAAVAARLAACAQISAPVTSVYRWRGEIRTDEEWQILFKTTHERYPELESLLLAEHPYATPEIIATDVVRGSAAYLDWIVAETRETRETPGDQEPDTP
ncbi:divalent-cation tolerance protein CutA [Streptomyces yaizuensis]|uniref:Divalent-cation tolerance protein CutA n=1 Tax=Streptomyces yaizuensis TaxID=2989713 RepID=A0ABQ5NUE5_9ACTN|nr:divalent-cation tolerance protein CutA [Streptomyces sp. YSPA8]GLF93819.1 hypothetical protein SYYSPA8_06000 [Streptomyces sp. YSPA8]